MEAQLMAWVSAHAIQLFIAYVTFNAAVQSLPRPTEKSNAFYVWLYRFAHLIAMNLKLVAQPMKTALPGLPETPEVK